MLPKITTNFFPYFFPHFTYIHPRLPKLLSKKIPKKVVKKSQNPVRKSLVQAWLKIMEAINEKALPHMIGRSEIQSILQLGRTATFNTTRDPSFPTPYGISGRHYLWKSEEVYTWLETRKGFKPRTRGPKNEIERIKIVNGITFEKVGA